MSWSHPEYEPQIVYLPTSNTWRCLIRVLPSGTFRSLEPAQPGHATPDAALSTASQRLSDLLTVREESLVVATVRLLSEGRLRPVSAPPLPPDPSDSPISPNPPNPPPTGVQWFQARQEDGTWTEAFPTPQAATRTVLDKVSKKGDNPFVNR